MAEKKIGKGRGGDFNAAAEAAKQDSGHTGWFKILEAHVHIGSPIREYHVTLQPVDNPPS